MGKSELDLLGSGKGQETEVCTLLVYYAAYSGNSLPTFGDNLSLPSSRVQGSRIKELDSSPMRMRPIDCTETSARY
jgi:hypothetical protein